MVDKKNVFVFLIHFSKKVVRYMPANYGEMERKFEAAGQPIISILENMHDGFLVMERDGTIIYLNEVSAAYLQKERTTVLGKKIWDILPIVVGSEFHRQLHQAVLKEIPLCFESFYEPLHKYFEWTIHPSKEMVSIYCKDITERKQKEEILNNMIYYDMLTGLPSLKLFQDRLEQAIVYSKNYHESVAVLMVDLDRLKYLNPNSKDYLLKEVANKLKELLAERGTVSRMNNDRFICFHLFSERTKLLVLLEKVISFLTNPILILGEHCFITPSIGISMYPFDGEDPQTLLSHAELAMEQVKESGGNQYYFYKKEMERDIKKNYLLMAELSKAFINDEFQMFYQPLIDVKSGKISSVETLLRWKHPIYGFISPDDFIPLAEEVGTIVEIGHWVLRKTCQQIKTWQETGISLPVSINLSAKQLQQENIVSLVKETLKETDIDPKLLKIEVTESVMMQNVETTIDILQELKAFGVQIAIDDFGTYYSSLQYLKNFPLDMIKIDRCFVRDMLEHEKDREIVRMVIELSHRLGMKVVAEGVENKTQLELLKELACDEVQGYFYSKPMEITEVNRYVKSIGVKSG